MDEVVAEILKLEETAQRVVAKARAEEKELDEVINAETQKLHQAIRERAQTKCGMVRRVEAAAARERIADVEAEYKKKSAELRGKYEANKDKWAREMFDRIITQKQP